MTKKTVSIFDTKLQKPIHVDYHQSRLEENLNTGEFEEIHIPLVKVNRNLRKAYSAVVRPANTTPYSIGEIIGNNDPNTNMMFQGLPIEYDDSYSIVKVMLVTTNPLCSAKFRLHLFNSMVGPKTDKDPFVLAMNMQAIYEGFIDFETFVNMPELSYSIVFPLQIPIYTTNQITDLYGILTAKTAYTPLSSEILGISIYAE